MCAIGFGATGIDDGAANVADRSDSSTRESSRRPYSTTRKISTKLNPGLATCHRVTQQYFGMSDYSVRFSQFDADVEEKFCNP